MLLKGYKWLVKIRDLSKFSKIWILVKNIFSGCTSFSFLCPLSFLYFLDVWMCLCTYYYIIYTSQWYIMITGFGVEVHEGIFLMHSYILFFYNFDYFTNCFYLSVNRKVFSLNNFLFWISPFHTRFYLLYISSFIIRHHIILVIFLSRLIIAFTWSIDFSFG